MTTPGHPGEPAGGQPAARPGDHGGAASTGGAAERVGAARSAACPCRARAGAPCRPDGDHLARYLRAWHAGTLTRESLKHAIDGLDVIAPQAIVPAPAGPAPRALAATAASPPGRQAGADAGTGPAIRPVAAEPEPEAG